MKIEIGINPNCSEATIRFRTNKLTKNQEEELFKTLESFVEKYGYETNVFRSKIFNIECITVDGDAPYNDSIGLMNAIKSLPFIDKVEIQEEEK